MRAFLGFPSDRRDEGTALIVAEQPRELSISEQIKRGFAVLGVISLLPVATAGATAARIQNGYQPVANQNGHHHWDHLRDTVPFTLLAPALFCCAAGLGTGSVEAVAVGAILLLNALPTAGSWIAGVTLERLLIDWHQKNTNNTVANVGQYFLPAILAVSCVAAGYALSRWINESTKTTTMVPVAVGVPAVEQAGGIQYEPLTP